MDALIAGFYNSLGQPLEANKFTCSGLEKQASTAKAFAIGTADSQVLL